MTDSREVPYTAMRDRSEPYECKTVTCVVTFVLTFAAGMLAVWAVAEIMIAVID